MNRQAQAVVLFLVGVAVLRASLTDVYLRYVKAGLRPLLLVTAVVLIVVAVATVWYEWRRARAAGRNATGKNQTRRARHDERDHAHHEPRIAWLLVLPLFALILVAPPALGSYAADRAGTALQPPVGFADLPAGDPLSLSVLDYAGRAVYDHGRSLDRRRITITGFITIGRDGTPYLTRMILGCCAADAQPIKVGLAGQVPPVLQPDTWLEVLGTYTTKQTTDTVNDGPIPFIDVIEARPVPAPPEEYES